MSRLTVVDSSLRDGTRSVAHRFTAADATDVAGALHAAGIEVIEVTHGHGLGGSSIQYGIAAVSDEELVAAAAHAVHRAAVAVLVLPGVGTLRRLRTMRTLGASVARVATHGTEADIARQHISWARENGLRAVGFLMMSHISRRACWPSRQR